jgi:hypothetical protein
MVKALNLALSASVEIDPRDGAAVNLARILAKSVDEGRMQDAPKLLAVMAQLGLTPGGRRPAAAQTGADGAAVGAVAGDGGGSGAAALARIRARRAAQGA